MARVGFAASLAFMAFLALSPASASAGHFYSTSFGSSGSGAGQLNEPKGVAVDNSESPTDSSKGDIYVADTGNHRIDKFDSTGKFILTFGDKVNATTGGNVCTAASGDACQAGVAGSGEGQFTTPVFVAVDSSGGTSDGDVYVGDSATNLVSKYDSSGNFISANSGSAAPSGPFGSPGGIAVDSTGNLLVTGSSFAEYQIVDEFAQSGSFIEELTLKKQYNSAMPVGIALDSHNNIFVVRNVNFPAAQYFEKYNPLGEYQGQSSPPPEQFMTGIAADPQSSDIFTDEGSVIVDYQPSGAPGSETYTPTQTFGEGALQGATGLAAARTTDTVYTANTASNAIAVFTTSAPPVIDETSAINVTSDSADLRGRVDPADLPSSYHFEYVGDAAFKATGFAHATSAPLADQPLGEGGSDIAISALVQELQTHSTYHYRLVATNKDGITYSTAYEFTTEPGGGELAVADGRHWEMVSPPSKLGAFIYTLDSEFFEALNVQASDNGNAIAYMSNAPIEANPPGDGQGVMNLATRGANGWSSQVITPPHSEGVGISIGNGAEYRAFSEDLSKGLDLVIGNFTPLSPEATEQTPYLRTVYEDGDVNAHCASSCYQPLVTGSNTPAGTKFGGTKNGVCVAERCGPQYAGATPDLSHVLLYSGVNLTSTAVRGEGLYEWGSGELKLVSVLPKEEGEKAVYGELGDPEGDNVWQHAISDDGSLVVWWYENGLYLRDTETGKEETIRLDLPEGGAGQSSGPEFMAASSDLSKIFFLDGGALTASSKTEGGADLYEYDLNAPVGRRLTDLTPGKKAGESGQVGAVIGVSGDGSYVYYSAHGELFEYHDGTITPIAEPEFARDSEVLYDRTARVSPNGHWLTFMSSLDLTGYDTSDAVSGALDSEVYLYNGETHKLVCASCNPTGARPIGRLLEGTAQVNADGVFANTWVSAVIPPWSRNTLSEAQHQSRYLSDSGRLFFDSNEALVPQDVNGTMDVYEYEPPGDGSCTSSSITFSERSGGCVGLISSGASPQESSFMEASETGADVFFLTTAKLQPQDVDTAYDIYDAHECTSEVPCYPAAPVLPPPCETGSACKAAEAVQPPIFGAPSSETFSGAGNITPAPEPKVVQKKSLTRAQKLAKALAVCHKDGKRAKRAACERQAKKRYGGKAARRARTSIHNGSTGTGR